MSGVAAPARGLDDACHVELGPYRLALADSFGPRILGLRLGDGPQMLAALGDDVVIDRPDSGVYRFRGGHRLWASPEVPWVSYAPDDDPCKVVVADDSVTITGPADRVGLTKEISVRLDGDRLVLLHTLGNTGDAPIEVAAWAITQLRLGGTAIVPLKGRAGDGLQADRSLILWPYTNLADPRISWSEQGVVIRAEGGAMFKIGTGPEPGCLGYLIDGHLFTKEVQPQGDGVYPDRGAVAQFFINPDFCELESVGAIVTLGPGDETRHQEVWEVTRSDDLNSALERVMGEAAR